MVSNNSSLKHKLKWLVEYYYNKIKMIKNNIGSNIDIKAVDVNII